MQGSILQAVGSFPSSPVAVRGTETNQAWPQPTLLFYSFQMHLSSLKSHTSFHPGLSFSALLGPKLMNVSV